MKIDTNKREVVQKITLNIELENEDEIAYFNTILNTSENYFNQFNLYPNYFKEERKLLNEIQNQLI